MTLPSRQRSYLKSLAHPLSATVRIGRGRLSSGVIAETERSLDAHELIKVRLDLEDSSERNDVASLLARETSSELVGTVGKIAIYYRPRAETPKIKLP